MTQRPPPTEGVLRARRYAACVRIVIAASGSALLVADPSLSPHTGAAAIGLGVIGLTGVVEGLVRHERWLRLEEALSCLAAIFIIGLGEGQVTVITMLWLVAAATGVLARGGRVGGLGRVLVVGALLSPMIMQGRVTAESLGLALSAIALLLAVGRISRETAELLRRARYDADHDALTGLLAGDAFRARVDALVPRATVTDPAALVLVDLDGFGAVNKRHGHAAGDALLVQVTEAMTNALSEEVPLGRVGGDEFAAFIFSADPESAARGLLDGVARAVGPHSATASAGLALTPQDGDDAEGLLAAADVALRVAKREGKHGMSVYWGAPLSSDSPVGARASLERLVRGEGLAMAVQPIVDLKTGRAHAYEALARFATHGGEGPLHWFSLADELGMRAELELACLDAALELLPTLPQGSRLSVNLSAPMLVDPRARQRIEELEEPSRVILEVTEETLVRHGSAVERTIARLRERGTPIAVDDLGAGYSGLGQLAALRPAYVKLDRSLVRDIDSDPSRESLVRLLVDYALSSGGLLVAEGVETVAELAVVRSAGVPLVQGYLLARPGQPWPEVATEPFRSHFEGERRPHSVVA